MGIARLTWVGHGTFFLQTDRGARYLLDGFIESCPTVPKHLHGDGLGGIDAIIVSHGHGDHVADVATHQNRTDATVLAIVELAQWFTTQGIAEDKIIGFNKGGTVELHDGTLVTMVDAKHSSSTPEGYYAGEPAGFIIKMTDGFTIYWAGDTTIFGDMSLIGELYKPDLAILPIGGHFTMDPVLASKAVELLGVKQVVGGHWGTFTPLVGKPSELAKLVPNDVKVHQLELGGSLSLTKG